MRKPYEIKQYDHVKYLIVSAMVLLVVVVAGIMVAQTVRDFKEYGARKAQDSSPASCGVIVVVGGGQASNVAHLEKLIEDRQRTLGIIE